jgi:hypothetical protein
MWDDIAQEAAILQQTERNLTDPYHKSGDTISLVFF